MEINVLNTLTDLDCLVPYQALAITFYENKF